MADQYKILIIEDEKDIREPLIELLQDEGYKVLAAHDGVEGVRLAQIEQPDLILLDILMPGLDGISACTSLRNHEKTKRIPVIMLTALRDELQRIGAFTAGADDFITKPFSTQELLVRVGSKIRRIREQNSSGDSILKCGNLTVNKDSLEVRVGGQLVTLSLLEFNLLKYLVENKGKLCSRQSIVEAVWGDATVSVRLLDPHILSIRRRIKGCDHDIFTIYGGGYIFKMQEAQATVEP